MKFIYNTITLEHTPYIPKYRFIKYISVFLLSFCMFLIGVSLPRPIREVMVPVVVEKIKQSPFSEESLKLKLKELGVNHPEIILKQAKLETGNFTSELFLEANNLFGMKVARKRIKLQMGEYIIGNEIYARYERWEDSVVDYAMWQITQCPESDSLKYSSFLGNYYSLDSNYTKKLKTIEI